jgi:hypothetical protein
MGGNQFRLRALGTAKIYLVNGELTVTNLIPPCQPHTPLRLVTNGA